MNGVRALKEISREISLGVFASAYGDQSAP